MPFSKRSSRGIAQVIQNVFDKIVEFPANCHVHELSEVTYKFNLRSLRNSYCALVSIEPKILHLALIDDNLPSLLNIPFIYWADSNSSLLLAISPSTAKCGV